MSLIKKDRKKFESLLAKERALTNEVTKRGRAWMKLANQRLEHIKALRAALAPFAKFGHRLMDGKRSHVPASGSWYGLDSGEPTEATLDIEHFKAAMSLVKCECLGCTEARKPKGRTLKRRPKGVPVQPGNDFTNGENLIPEDKL